MLNNFVVHFKDINLLFIIDNFKNMDKAEEINFNNNFNTNNSTTQRKTLLKVGMCCTVFFI